MKGIPRASLLVLALVALSQAWSEYSPRETRGQDYSPEDTHGQDYSSRDTRGQDYSPEDTYGQDYSPRDTRGQDYIPEDTYGQDYSPRDTRGQDYSSEDTSEQEDTSKDTLGQDPQLDVLQVLRGFNADSNDYPEVRSFNADSDEYPESRGFNAEYNDYPENDPSYSRRRRGRGEEIRNSIRKVKSKLQKRPKAEQGTGDEGVHISAVDENITYVTLRPLPAQDRNYPISRTLAEKVLQIIKGISGVGRKFPIPMTSIRCSIEFPAPKKTQAYSSSQLTIKMDLISNTNCFYQGSSYINNAISKASVTFSMSPEAHFIINRIEVEPEMEDDFRESLGSKNNPLDTILAYSRSLINFYLKESVDAVFDSL